MPDNYAAARDFGIGAGSARILLLRQDSAIPARARQAATAFAPMIQTIQAAPAIPATFKNAIRGQITTTLRYSQRIVLTAMGIEVQVEPSGERWIR
jgi:hypothetical protein